MTFEPKDDKSLVHGGCCRFFQLQYTNRLLKCLLNHNTKHYQKFVKYQRIYRRNMSVGNLRSKLPTNTFPSVIQSVTTADHFPSIIQSVTTNKNFPSVITDWITDGKVSELKKRRVADVEVLAGYFFSTESPMNSKRQLVQWRDRFVV